MSCMSEKDIALQLDQEFDAFNEHQCDYTNDLEVCQFCLEHTGVCSICGMTECCG
jgi:hypothetical protein